MLKVKLNKTLLKVKLNTIIKLLTKNPNISLHSNENYQKITLIQLVRKPFLQKKNFVLIVWIIMQKYTKKVYSKILTSCKWSNKISF